MMFINVTVKPYVNFAVHTGGAELVSFKLLTKKRLPLQLLFKIFGRYSYKLLYFLLVFSF